MKTKSTGSNSLKITKRQKEIIKLMQSGFPLMMGQSDFTGKQYFMIASTHNNGFGNTYFRSDVFSNLLDKELIYFSNHSSEYELTDLGLSI